MVFNRSIKRLTQTNAMNWFLKTFISLISLVPSGLWKRPGVDQTHEKSPKTNDTRYRGGTLRLMVVHYLEPGRVFGPEACERVWRLQMSCLHLWHQQFFFFRKKKNKWLHDISLQNCVIVHAKRSEQVLRGALTRGGACWQAATQAIVIPYFLEYSQPEPIISFLASKGGDYSREATISNIAHCESCSKYFVLLSQ